MSEEEIRQQYAAIYQTAYAQAVQSGMPESIAGTMAARSVTQFAESEVKRILGEPFGKAVIDSTKKASQ